MTSSVALAANVAPVTHPSTTSDASNTSSAQDSFRQPLQQARQQYARPSDTPRETHGAHAHARASSSKKNSSTQDDSTDTSATNTPAAATAAMLALLNQSVPASAAASAVSTDADDAAEAVTTAGASGIAAANAALLGATQAAGQAKAGDADDFTKAMDGVTDKSLTMFAQGADEAGDSGDAVTDTATPALGGDTFADALQALTTATGKQGEGKNSDPLNALKNLGATAMTQQAQSQASPATTSTPHVLTMQSSVDSPSFGQELSQQVTWLGGQDVKEARIRLHPEDLGELDVKVSVKQDHVDVAFIAQHPQAVHAVQQTLTQLDTMLAHHGLSLGQAMVGQGNTGNGSSSQSASSGSGKGSSGGGNGLLEDVGEVASVVSPVAKAVGLVDMFV